MYLYIFFALHLYFLFTSILPFNEIYSVVSVRDIVDVVLQKHKECVGALGPCRVIHAPQFFLGWGQ